MNSNRIKNRRRPVKAAASLPVINPHAVGIDVGATQMYVCLPPDSCAEPIAVFDAFTDDLINLVALIKKCGGLTVAIESTGVYWIPLFELLEQEGLEVLLVNPSYRKSYTFKSDVEDCQKLQFLHAVGLLNGSFRPPNDVCAIRAIVRHRNSLVKESSAHIQRMQKSLTQMNVLIDNVITDITGVTGLAIIDAILSGERRPLVLANHRDYRIKASIEEIAKSLKGNYRDEHLFTLKQSLEAYRFLLRQMAECDAKIAAMMAAIDNPAQVAGTDKTNAGPNPPAATDAPSAQACRANQESLPKTSPTTNLTSEMRRLHGVDLTRIPGIGPPTVQGLFTEIGTDMSKFPTAGHFTSWLGLSPDNRISGGKVLSTGTRKVKSNASKLLRVAAQSLARSHSYLGSFYRRMRARSGPKAANTATANKLARIIYHLLTTKESYDESVFNKVEEHYKQKRLLRMQKEAEHMGYKLAPA